MGTIVLWVFAVVGGVIGTAVAGFWILEALAARAQREGRNWFQ